MVACCGFLPEERHWGCAVEKGWQGGPRTPRHFWHGVFAALLRRWPGRCPDGWCLRFCLHTSFHPLCEWAWPSLPADRGWIFQYRVNKKMIWKKVLCDCNYLNIKSNLSKRHFHHSVPTEIKAGDGLSILQHLHWDTFLWLGLLCDGKELSKTGKDKTLKKKTKKQNDCNKNSASTGKAHTST